MTRELQKIREWRDVDARMWREDILPLNQPAILKGLVADWPSVQAGLTSPQALSAYIKGFDTGAPADIIIGHPSIRGRLFYGRDLRTINFNSEKQPIGALVDGLMRQLHNPQPHALAIQSAPIPDLLPGFETANPLALIASAPVPRIWIGNALTIAAHFDPYDNIACVVGGRRRFTLFPPAEVANLYVGPLECTPAGAPISLVDFDAPDLAHFPRFEQALAAAQTAELEPGDAIYIPYLWWHHVRSLDAFNVLVNYWWNDARPVLGSPFEWLMLGLISLRDLPPTQRQAWRAVWDHWVFQVHGDPVAHLPPQDQGALGPTTPDIARTIREDLLRSLGGG